MNCTKCKSGVLQPSFLDGLFRAHTCSGCGGNWILVEDFVAWKEQNSEFQFAADHTVTEDTEDTKKALLCPVTGTIMRKFKITAGTDHRVDYSAPVGGIWLDKGEWDLLKSEQVAGTLNNVVTQHWQKQIQRESSASNLSAIYSQKFGEENYEKVKAIRAWLINQPNKADLRAYLLAEDPYSASK
ncbi:MAG: hypothetical protein CL586_04880 [Alteromonadaceae bacterium]|nr:hypothetical protein [Alteromonadaceae bacterium]|tara:strand:- start:296 stop:850 length:555 start_codon:yes stop_codon:yes gene_type:complete